MYFGDEDPVLLADKRKTLASNLPSSPQEDDKPRPSETHPPNSPPPQDNGQSDPVLLFNEESGSFEYSSASGGGKDSLNESGQGNGTDVEAGKVHVLCTGIIAHFDCNGGGVLSVWDLAPITPLL